MVRPFAVVVLSLLCFTSVSKADFGGPIQATRALSPDGNLVVRVTPVMPDDKDVGVPKHEVTYFHFDSTSNSYAKRHSFQMSGFYAHLLYVSNEGDLLLASLGKKDALRLFAKEGKLVKSWSLGDFLSDAEIKACAETGSTLQWLEEGSFYGRNFYFKGPSRSVRALSPPFTIMRGVDEKVSFSGSIDAKEIKLSKDEPEEP